MIKINRYGGLDAERQQELIRIFCADIGASQAAERLNLNRKTVNRYYNIFRTIIADHVERRKNLLVGTFNIEIEYVQQGQTSLDTEPFQGISKVLASQTSPALVGFYQRDGRYFTDLFTEHEKVRIRAMVRRKASAQVDDTNSGWTNYAFIIDSGSGKGFRFTAQDGVIRPQRLSPRNEEFWSYIQSRLSKFNGVKRYFYLHLKESEWRWLKDPVTLQDELLKLIAKNPQASLTLDYSCS